MAALAQRGHDVRQLQLLGQRMRPELLVGCDLLHIHRHHDETAMRLLRHARRNGIAVVWDNDDDISAIPRSNPLYRVYGGASGTRSLAAVRKMVQRADLVTTPSRRLVELYTGYGARRVLLIENYIRDESAQLPLPQRPRDRVLIGWMAGREHRADLEQLSIRPALDALLQSRPEVQVVSIGLNLGLQSDRYQHIPSVHFEVLNQVVAQFDVGLAPIADTPLNWARSNVKVKEYASVGVPWLASATGPYRGLGEREGGRLVPDDGWDEALAAVVRDQRARHRLAANALAWGRGQTVSSHADEWERALNDVVEHAAIASRT